MKKLFTICATLFGVMFNVYAQQSPLTQRSRTSDLQAISLERPNPGNDGFTICAKYNIKLSSGVKERMFRQEFSVPLKKGEHFQVSVSGAKFRVAVSARFKADSLKTLGSFRDQIRSKEAEESFVQFDSSCTKDGTLLFTVFNDGTATGDELYSLNVIIGDISVRKLSSIDFCDKLLFLMTHTRYDYFMLKGEFIEREETKTGYIDGYTSLLRMEKDNDEIALYANGFAEYSSLLYSDADIKEAKKKLDEYISKTRQCLAKWGLEKKEDERTDEGLGKAFGTVSYTVSYTDKGKFPYFLSIGLGENPKNKKIMVLLQLSLD